MEKIKNMSFQKTIIIYLSIALAISFFASALIVSIATIVQKNVWSKYIDNRKYDEADQLENDYGFIVDIPRISNVEMTDSDVIISETCDFLETWTILILSMAGSVRAIFLFYRNKLKKPLEILTNASKQIAENQLDFKVQYDIKDEMGSLCHEFERMRAQLEINNKEMWKMVEQEKNLRAAIAHDIRSPLAVLRGYHEILLEFIPLDRLDKQKMEDILKSSMGQIDRLNNFVDTMKKLTKLDDLQIKYQRIHSTELDNQVEMLVKTICDNRGLEWTIKKIGMPDSFAGDLSIIMEVGENLLSNASRYAKEKIEVHILQEGDELCIAFYDDGTGFIDDIDKVTEVYYHSNPGDDLNHFGLGLYICRLYCEKHGGKLLLGNSEAGGAYAKACFEIKMNAFES